MADTVTVPANWPTIIDAFDAATTVMKQPRTNTSAVTGRTANGVPTGAPSVRRGEDAQTSRPFSFLRMLGLAGRALAPEYARTEYEILRAFRQGMEETQSVPASSTPGSVMMIGDRKYLPEAAGQHKATHELMRAMTQGSMGTVDRDEILWIARNGESPEVRRSAMSYLVDTIGGSLVAPAQMGELIPLMRNRSALDQAGAQNVPLPPQGKWVAPRITGPTTGYWITEGVAITESNPTTGEATMMAKKLGVLIRINNELFRYTSPAVDSMIQADAAKTLALGFDYAGLYGAGGAGQPKGLILYTDANQLFDYAGKTPTPVGVGTNGNTLQPQDGFQMVGQIEDRNFDTAGFAWIMRPLMKAAILGRRADAVTTADQAGQFVQSQFRTTADGLTTNWDGFKIAASSQVRNNQTKGGGTNLTEVWGGVWPEFLMGVYGAVEFVANTFGEATFTQDQTLVRGILHCDCVPKYPGAFTFYKQLIIQ